MKTKIQFLDYREIEVVVLAQLGRSNKRISESTGFTDAQVSYRLAKAKIAQGYEKFHTYRSEWRNGTSAIAKAIENQFVPKIRSQVERTLPPLFKPSKADNDKGLI